jgi:hypothetical protein
VTGGRFVIRSPSDNGPAASKIGSIIFASTSTGEVLARFYGDREDDQLSFHSYVAYVAPGIIDSQSVFQLPNGNFVLTNSLDDKESLVDSGFASILSGGDLSEIARIEGKNSDDKIGWRILNIDDGRFALANPWHDQGGFENNGSIFILDAKTGLLLQEVYGTGNESLLGMRMFTTSPGKDFIFASDSLIGSETIKALEL